MFDPCAAHRLLARDAEDMSAAEQDAAVAAAARLRSWADAREAVVVRQRDAGPKDPSDPAKDAADRIRRQQNVSRGEAQRRAQTAEQLGHLPGTQDALENGAITGDHAAAMARGRAKADQAAQDALADAESDLLDAAANESPEAFRKRVDEFIAEHQAVQDGLDEYDEKRRQRKARFWRDKDGMLHLSAIFDPDLGAEVRSSIERRAEELWRGERSGREDEPIPASERDNEQRTADAIGLTCRRADGAEVRDGRHRPNRVGVSMTLENLTEEDDSPARRADGSPVPAAVARRMACERGVIPFVLGGQSVPLDWGRSRRFASPQQVDALGLQYDTCTLFGCTAPADWCDAHHILPFDPGKTDLINLTFACNHCHDLVHRPGWGVEKRPDGVIRSWAPDGQEWFQHPRNRRRRRRSGPQPAAVSEVENFDQQVLV